MNTINKLQDIFRDVFDDDEIEINQDMTANDLEDWDSLMHIQLLVAAEEKFSIKFSTAEVLNLKNVGDFVALIDKKLENK
ncbi:MAG: acyl carrier protein [Candidatus Ancillula sp.]|jgi:acyl carrier protein|nr:acyl carrier protein [Candidatus Ancillula sp.]